MLTTSQEIPSTITQEKFQMNVIKKFKEDLEEVDMLSKNANNKIADSYGIRGL